MVKAVADRRSYEHWLEYVNSIDVPVSASRTDLVSSSEGPAQRGRAVIRSTPKSHEVLVQCPKCKTFETLQFAEDNLTPCRKFSQRDGKIYHDCGSELPCHLHSWSVTRNE